MNIAWYKVAGEAHLVECTAKWFEALHISQAWNQMDVAAEALSSGQGGSHKYKPNSI